jgi:hypothetical protein
VCLQVNDKNSAKVDTSVDSRTCTRGKRFATVHLKLLKLRLACGKTREQRLGQSQYTQERGADAVLQRAGLPAHFTTGPRTLTRADHN